MPATITDKFLIYTPLTWDGSNPMSSPLQNLTFDIHGNATRSSFLGDKGSGKFIDQNDSGTIETRGITSLPEHGTPGFATSEQTIKHIMSADDLSQITLTFANGATLSPAHNFDIAILQDGSVVFLLDDSTTHGTNSNLLITSISFGPTVGFLETSSINNNLSDLGYDPMDEVAEGSERSDLIDGAPQPDAVDGGESLTPGGVLASEVNNPAVLAAIGIPTPGPVDGTSGNDTMNVGYTDGDGDQIDGSDGNDDTIYGHEGDDSIIAGDGDDIIYGGTGDDEVFGEAGDDVFMLEDDFGYDLAEGGDTGETSGDTLDLSNVTQDTTLDLYDTDPTIGNVASATGDVFFEGIENIVLGGGRDTIILGDGSGADRVHGFDLSDSGDGTTVDQLDVANLTSDGGITPVTVSDVVVTDTNGDGTGDAILTFPGGESLTLGGVLASEVNSPAVLAAMGVPNVTVDGTSGNDAMNINYTDAQGDQIDGADGDDDVIYGYDGNDTINAGVGDDTVDGGDGNDRIRGYAGDDSILGGDGNDRLSGNSGNDTLLGEDGEDTLSGAAGDDSLSGGVGDDRLSGNSGNDTLLGEDGRDFINAGTGDDSVSGGTGSDTIYSGLMGGADTLDAGADDDFLIFGSNDLALGGDGDDAFFVYDQFGTGGTATVVGGEGSEDLTDTVNGGAGDHLRLDFDGLGIVSDDYTVTATGDGAGTVTGSDTDVVFSEIEQISTGAGNDTIDMSADSSGMLLNGATGDDSIIGGSGDDTIYGSLGDDTIVYTGGNDLITDFNVGNSGTLSDGDNTNNDFIDLSSYYDHISELYADQADDNILNHSNNGVGGVDYSNNTSFGSGGLTFTGATPNPGFFTVENTGVVCFTNGTRIATPKGDVPIENLRPGDLVLTYDNGPQPLVWVTSRHLDKATLEANEKLRPILIQSEVIGADAPLMVSRQHSMLLKTSDSPETLVRAIHLAKMKGGKARIAHGCSEVVYYHLMFETHQVVFANGAPSESFYPGEMAVKALSNEDREELFQLFPGLVNIGSGGGYGEMSRGIAKREELPDQLCGIQPIVR